MEAYLDNSATTRVFPQVQQLMIETMDDQYGNPSSLHSRGMAAEEYVTRAAQQIADTLKVDRKEIIFTSGGTESNNMALMGSAFAAKRRGNHIITTQIEHASVSGPLKFLQEQGFVVTCLSVDREGHISLEELQEALCEETILVSLMYVNNEIGAVEPIAEAAKLVKAYNPQILIHVDAIQAYGKYVIRPKRLHIDLMSVSGHKIHGPKGVGFLYLNEKVRIQPLVYGGGQQKGMRSGTENVPGIAGMGLAARMMYEHHEEQIERLYQLRERLIKGMSEIEGVTLNGSLDRTNAPHIVSASFAGIRSEVLLHSLEAKGIYVSAGSACASNKPAVSATLTAIGVDQALLDSTLRFSFGHFNTEEQIDYTIEVLQEVLPRLRKYTRM